MYEFLHHVNLFQRLVHLERIHVDLLQSEGTVPVVPDQVYAAEGALTDDVNRFVLLLHTEI